MAHILPSENKAKVLMDIVVILFASSVRDYVLHHLQEYNLSREIQFFNFQEIFVSIEVWA